MVIVAIKLLGLLVGDNWSEEEDEELVFEEVVERTLSEAEAYDSSAENERDMFPTQRHRSLKLPWFRQPQRTVMSLLRRKRRKAQSHGDLVSYVGTIHVKYVGCNKYNCF